MRASRHPKVVELPLTDLGQHALRLGKLNMKSAG